MIDITFTNRNFNRTRIFLYNEDDHPACPMYYLVVNFPGAWEGGHYWIDSEGNWYFYE